MDKIWLPIAYYIPNFFNPNLRHHIQTKQRPTDCLACNMLAHQLASCRSVVRILVVRGGQFLCIQKLWSSKFVRGHTKTQTLCSGNIVVASAKVAVKTAEVPTANSSLTPNPATANSKVES